MLNLDDKYLQAKKKVEKIKAFYIHLFVYIIVNIGLIGINLFNFDGTLWFIYPLLGWGIGIASHAFAVLSHTSLFGKNWEERQIAKYMDED